MKNIGFICLAAALACPATAYATDAAVPPAPADMAIPAPAPAASAPMAPAPADMAMPAPGSMVVVAKKVELMDGSWALVEGDTVKISKDNGESWMPAPDETWVAKDGSKLATKDGKILK